MASKNTETKQASEQKKNEEQAKAYLADIRKLDKKHGMTFQPVIKHEPDGTMRPSMQLVNLPEEVKVDKKK